MNAIQQTHDHTSTSGTFKRVCVASCRKLLTQIESSKDSIFDEFRDLIGGQERMLRLALNEAEAIAWQTEYPHLIFPTLAHEKAEEVATWQEHALAIRESLVHSAFAA